MRCYLLNVNEQLVDKFDAVDAADARQKLIARCTADGATYILAAAVRKVQVTLPPPIPNVVETNL